jgi:hypothetical protein
MDLDIVSADCPILDVITIREVITLLLHLKFLLNRGNQGSKGFPEHYKVSRPKIWTR